MRAAQVVAAVAVLLGAAYFAILDRWPWRRLHVAPPIVVTTPWVEQEDTLRAGETISQLFARQGVNGLDLGSGPLDPRRLRAGLVFGFRREAMDSAPSQVTVRTGPELRIRFQREEGAWTLVEQPIAWQPELGRFEGPIDHSLYLAIDNLVPERLLDRGERRRLAWELADVYAWSVDFTRDIQPGDRVQVVFERLVSEEGEIRFGRILAADLQVNGRQQTAFHFPEPDGSMGFYDAEGRSLKRPFLRAPLEFRRISSGFSGARRHPILGVVRRHQGVDYSAAPGTPVLAGGDGVVIRAERAGGFGNLVELAHAGGIVTRYGHLQGFARGLRVGQRVHQRDVIGFVGSTGLSTAPHLHYEFLVNGVARDFRRVEVGDGEPIRQADRPAFEEVRDRLQGILAGADGAPDDAE